MASPSPITVVSYNVLATKWLFPQYYPGKDLDMNPDERAMAILNRISADHLGLRHEPDVYLLQEDDLIARQPYIQDNFYIQHVLSERVYNSAIHDLHQVDGTPASLSIENSLRYPGLTILLRKTVFSEESNDLPKVAVLVGRDGERVAFLAQIVKTLDGRYIAVGTFHLTGKPDEQKLRNEEMEDLLIHFNNLLDESPVPPSLIVVAGDSNAGLNEPAYITLFNTRRSFNNTSYYFKDPYINGLPTFSTPLITPRRLDWIGYAFYNNNFSDTASIHPIPVLPMPVDMLPAFPKEPSDHLPIGIISI